VRDRNNRARRTDHDHDPGHDDIGRRLSVNALLIHVLGAEIAHPGIWNPTIIGYLTVLCAIGLFCGSVYLLLATNLGGRLGFLVAFAGLMAFMVLLTSLWWSSGNSGLDPPHGHSPSWNVVEVLSPGVTPENAKTAAAANIATKGKPISSDTIVTIKPYIDTALVQNVGIGGQPPLPQKFAQFQSATDYVVGEQGLRAYEIGGGTKNLFWHKPRLAAIELCPAQANVTPPTCDPLKDTQFVILSYNYGTLRQPVVLYWFMSVALFILALLALHWEEQDERARRRAALAPVPTPFSN
jgi:hypothetical protein